jgi:OmpA-OmpF porin, OOP family
MKLRHSLTPTLAVALLSALTTGSALAQAPGFALNRFEPSERGSDFFAADSLDLRGKLRGAGGLVLDYSHDPLVLYDSDGEKLSGVVSDQFFAHLGASIIVEDRVRFGLSIPIALIQSGESGTAGMLRVSSDNASAPGDLRLSGDVRLFGLYDDPATMTLGLQFFAPTGSQESFTGDGAVRLIPRAQFAGNIEPVVYAASLGFQYRAADQGFAGDPRGDEVMLTAAVGLRALKKRLVVGPELFGSAQVGDSDAFFGRHRTPFELILGGHFAVSPDWRLGLGVGPGLTRALGTPAVRGLLSVEWVQGVAAPPPPAPPPPPPPPPPPDRDRDTVLDEVDACPDDPGQPTQDPATNGCPDTDKDGVFDRSDACPTVPGIKTEDPKTNGCPDRDGDKILDDVDACPDEPGVASQDPKKHGCPPPKDRDEDGILNEQDACPDAAGPADPDPKKNGCPAARVEKGQIRILEQVQFAYNSAQILKASDFILNAVAKILSENPQIKSVRVEGHTDNKGGDAFNKRLSQKRAEAVVASLIKRGIDKGRFTSQGFGMDRPIDSNDTDAGRANNRRVEFHIEGQEPAPAAP